jgi:hypothetical protein
VKVPENWLDEILPLPRPEYAKQTEALLTDLLWRSAGSTLGSNELFDRLKDLKAPGGTKTIDPNRLVPKRRHGGSTRLLETIPLAESVDLSGLVSLTPNTSSPVAATLASCLAPRARGDKSDAVVPVHPSAVCFQTLHGLVNKENPANLALAIETMGWLGGGPTLGSVAATFLAPYSTTQVPVTDGVTGFLDSVFPVVARHVWASLPGHFQVNISDWPIWPSLEPAFVATTSPAALSEYSKTPFTWFWGKWQRLCDASRQWHDLLPPRRFVDWALCLLRTGLAFSYLWEAEFFCRLHERMNELLRPGSHPANRLRSMLTEGMTLAVFEPPFVPAIQKDSWPATSQVLARGYEARKRFYDFIDHDRAGPDMQPLVSRLDAWLHSLTSHELEELAAPLETNSRTANNQKEFVRYLLRERTSDDDVVDQADFYYLARTNSRRHVWYHPGPEWLVVLTSLLCEKPGGETTLGVLIGDLTSLGVRVDRSVLIGLLEEAGLSTDSPDADDALVIRSGF